ncbi:hypothetical protein BVRB_6g149450 [Beta vulgaris subsp. vulgaris]|nr:hypothetical protein BVRB_6g149450 [Beta vulgaris subsp. vulgaris]
MDSNRRQSFARLLRRAERGRRRGGASMHFFKYTPLCILETIEQAKRHI